MTTNADLSNVVTPYLTDVGFGLVFGLGYYFIKYLYGDADKKTQTKAKNVEGYWSTAKTIDDFNILIKNNEEVVASAFAQINNIIGLDSSFGLEWS